MKVYELYEVPAYVTKRCTTRKCDLCGVLAKDQEDWSDDYRDIGRTSIQAEFGMIYQDCRETERYDIDLCPDCFVKRLIPWLNINGAKITPKWDD